MGSAPRDRLMRLALLSPAHLGSAWGEAALDRPTQVDAWRGLPFVPASALKGVMAGRRGNVGDAKNPNLHREPRYGSPDRPGKAGDASRVVIGDGRPLAFPVPARDGGRCWVFPAETLAWALRFGAAGERDRWREARSVLASLEAARREEGVLTDGPAPRLAGVEPLGRLRNVPPEEVAELFGCAAWAAGSSVPAGDPRVIAGGARAADLWRAGAERRHLAAIESGRKVVRAGALRVVELIPEGAVFLSQVSVVAGGDPELGRIQVGAWESQGFGWAELSWADPASAPEAEGPDVPGVGDEALRGAQEPLARTMDRALAAVRALVGAGSDVAAVGRTAVRRFGWRFREQGPEAVLAFELARARVYDPRPKKEMRAHRWLVAALLLDGDAEEAGRALGDGVCQPLVDWLEGQPFGRSLTSEESERVLARLGWLRRYGEIVEPEPPGTVDDETEAKTA